MRAAAAIALGWMLSFAAVAGEISGKVTTAKGGSGLLVYVVNAPGTFQPPSQPVMVDQNHLEFIPYIVAVLVGGTVEFKNSDKVAHNVFTPDMGGYNLGTFPPGQSQSHTFKETGIYTQLCSMHPEMEAFVVAVQNPYYAMTSADGSYVIKGVPDGSYTVRALGRAVKKKDRRKDFSVTVAGKATLDLAF
jgi:plastocyanin